VPNIMGDLSLIRSLNSLFIDSEDHYDSRTRYFTNIYDNIWNFIYLPPYTPVDSNKDTLFDFEGVPLTEPCYIDTFKLLRSLSSNKSKPI